MSEFTRLTGLSNLTDSLPSWVIMTDDPMRLKMLAAHWLQNARILYELRGLLGYMGSYNSIDVALVSVGYGEACALMYMHDAVQLGARRVVYLGECIARKPDIMLREVIIADSSDAELIKCALNAAHKHSIKAIVRDVETNDRFFIPGTSVSCDIVDMASSVVAKFASDNHIAALSILTVSQNTATMEFMEDHERQSRMNDASQLVFETIAAC